MYASMAALVIVLFFGATGITLNHPEWTLGFETETSTETGTIPSGAIAADGKLIFLTMSEYLRERYNVRGSVSDFGTTDSQSYISYRGPGYAADASIDTAAGTYELSIEQQGLVGVLNDLHKGRHASSSWRWLIDVAGGVLVFIALSGLGLQLFLKRRKRAALALVAVGGVLIIATGLVTLA